MNEYLLYEDLFDIRVINPAYYEILKRCNGSKTKEDIYYEIAKYYDFDICETSCRIAFEETIQKFLKSGIIIETEGISFRQTEYGERGFPYPILLALELTDACNHKCPFCYLSANPTGNNINLKIIDFIIENFANKTHYIMISGGEPTLHPCFSKIVEKLSNFFKLSLITNGSCINKISSSIWNYFSGIQISLYGFDEESYRFATGTSLKYKDLLNNIYQLSEIKPNLTVSIIITKQNIDSLEKYLISLSSTNVKNISFGIAIPLGRTFDGNSDSIIEPSDMQKAYFIVEKLREKYKDRFIISKFQDASKYSKKNVLDKFSCMAGKTSVIIGANGNVRPCNIIPAKFFSQISIYDYAENIKRRKEYLIGNALKDFDCFLKENGYCVGDVKCAGFCNI